MRSQQMQLEGMIIANPELKKILEKVVRASQVESTVLILGKSGVGKGCGGGSWGSSNHPAEKSEKIREKH